jgi:heterodisulfide reductase subunit C
VPGWRVHRFLDMTFFGKSYRKIHENMDSAVVVLGRKHRILFHDPLWACAIAQECYPNYPNAVHAANLHILADQLCSSDPGLKRMLENLEMLDRRKRKRIGKQAPKMDDNLAKVFSDLKKIEEIKRMLRFLHSQ